MTKLRTLTFSSALLTSVGATVAATYSAASAATAPPIYVDGARTSVGAIERGDRVFVPLRGVFERLGASVAYGPGGTIVARKRGRSIAQLALDERSAIINGDRVQLDVSPFRAHARTYVPLRFISQASGAAVTYVANPKSVRIQAPAEPVASVPDSAVVAPASAPIGAAHSGLPWWLWLLPALIVLGVLLAVFMRRKPEPTIITRSSSGDPDLRR